MTPPLPPHIDISKLRPGTRLLVETVTNVWSFTVTVPENLRVEVSGTDERFKNLEKPVLGMLVLCEEPIAVNARQLPGCIAKGWTFLIDFANCRLIGNQVVSARVEGDGWSYEAFE